jgi:hypothetical protein
MCCRTRTGRWPRPRPSDQLLGISQGSRHGLALLVFGRSVPLRCRARASSRRSAVHRTEPRVAGLTQAQFARLEPLARSKSHTEPSGMTRQDARHDTWGCVRMLRQVVGDLVPRCFRFDIDVRCGPNDRVVVERAERQAEHFGMIAKKRGQRGATHAAKRARFARRRLVARDERFTREPSKRRCQHGHAGAKRRAGCFAAHRAVTVHRIAEKAVHFVAYAAAQAGSVDAHDADQAKVQPALIQAQSLSLLRR